LSTLTKQKKTLSYENTKNTISNDTHKDDIKGKWGM